MTLPNNNPASHAPSSDSPDAHIIPAETAARKNREGDHYKQPPENSESADSIDTTGGFTVDQEGLVNNYAAEPEMYYETPGDAQVASETELITDTYTLVDVFPAAAQAENAVAEMRKAGLTTTGISIVGKNYQNNTPVHGALNWQDIAQTGGLTVVLSELGITRSEAVKYEAQIEMGKVAVVVIGSKEDIDKANQVLHTLGHRTKAEEVSV